MKNCPLMAICIFAASAVAQSPRALATIVFTNQSTISEDFAGLSSTQSISHFPLNTITPIPGTTGWDATKAGGSSSNLPAYNINNGGANAGAIYSYGADASTERALGSVASGTQTLNFGFALRNDSPTLRITALAINFTQELWRSAENANTVAAHFGTTASGVGANYLPTAAAGFSAVPALNLSAPAAGAAAALNGNANQTAKSFTITGLNVGPGESFYLKWIDLDDGGADGGLAIDDFSMAVSAVPEASAFLFGGLICMIAGVWTLWRKRQVAEAKA